MGKFGRLTVRGFRRLLDVSLELRPLTVVIGANGCGKTAVLDVLTLLANSAQGRLSGTISELSGVGAILTHDRAPELELGLVSDAEAYRLVLQPQGVGYVIREEKLESRGVNRIDASERKTSYYNADGILVSASTPKWSLVETALSQVPRDQSEPEEFRLRLASSTHYHSLNVDARSSVRLPQPLGPAELPGRNGEDLVSCLFAVRENHRDRFELIEATLRVAFPSFERLEFPPVAAGTVGLAWRERGRAKPFYAHQLSEGTLRFLWLTALLESPGLTSATLLDEPEVGLHPELIMLLADLLRDASRRSQVVVATHSDALIRFLKPEEVVVCDSDEDGMTTLTRADELDLDDWLKDYSLDELWRNGRLGARA